MGAVKSKRRLLGGIVAVLCAGLSFQSVAYTDAPKTLASLVFITEEYPPYNYLADRQLNGISVDLLELIFDATDTPLSRDDIRYYPWVRGYELALNRPNTVLFSTTRTPAREANFQWVGPIAQDQVVLLAHRDTPFVINSLAQAVERGLTVAVIREDIGAHALIEANYPDHLMLSAIDNRSALHMLMRGRVDLWAYSADVAAWIAESEGYPKNNLIPIHTLSESSLYFAINQATDSRLVALMQQALERVQRENTQR